MAPGTPRPATGGSGGDIPVRRRAAWGTISREQVVDAAARVIDQGRYEQLTIRGLAADLGVTPMALYRHVRGKDDLLDEVADRMLTRVWAPQTGRDDWRAWTTELAGRLRDLLVAHPAALHVYLRHPVTSPAAMARMEAMLEVLQAAGFDEGQAQRAYAAIQTYTIGFAALEASRSRWVPEDGEDGDGAALLMERRLAAFSTPEQFADGLGYLLDGIEHGPGRPVPRGRRRRGS